MGEMVRVIQLNNKDEVEEPVYTKLYCITIQSGLEDSEIVKENEEDEEEEEELYTSLLRKDTRHSCASLPFASSLEALSPIFPPKSAPASLSCLYTVPVSSSSQRNGSYLPLQAQKHDASIVLQQNSLKRSHIITYILLCLTVFIVSISLMVAGVRIEQLLQTHTLIGQEVQLPSSDWTLLSN